MALKLEARNRRTGDPVWERPLPDGPFALAGDRANRPDPLEVNGEPVGAVWRVPDKHLSFPHARLVWRDGRLHVRRRLTPEPTVNKLYDAARMERDEIALAPGEWFDTGETKFALLSDDEVTVAQFALEAVDLSFDSQRQIAALQELFNAVGSLTDVAALEAKVLRTLLDGITDSTAAALVALHLDSTDAVPGAEIRRDLQGTGVLTLSQTLVQRAVRGRRGPAWSVRDRSIPISLDPNAQGNSWLDAGNDWAVCVPLADVGIRRDLALYVNGRFPRSGSKAGPEHVDAFLTAATKFVQLTATQLDHLFQTLALRRQQVQLESLLPPAVVRALAGQPNLADVLKPQVVTATVMLCDLRGFSALAEKSPLPELLQRVNLALSEMTTFITEFDGVIGDFQGDSALGFWGWPAPTPDQAELAARAALAVRRRFQKGVAHFDELLADFSCGIGLAHGECVAGRLGTADLMKVGVFGPVVNLAARLEGLTKTFGVPVVVDAALATELRATGAGRFVLRRLARVRPAGMTKTVEIFELLPREADRPVSLERPRITDRNLTDYEEGLALFERGDWSAALMVLSRVPGHDGPSSFLRRYIDAAGGMPSADWEGMVAFQKPAG